MKFVADQFPPELVEFGGESTEDPKNQSLGEINFMLLAGN